MFFGLHGLMDAFGPESGPLSLIVGGFTLWMLIDCLRKDPERQLWWWIIIVVPVLGPLAYFAVRWLPTHNLRLPRWAKGMTRGGEIRRLQSIAHQIGNPYQHVQLGDALRDVGQHRAAHVSYLRALEKEPANLPALWGAAQIDLHEKSFDSARERLDKVLQADPLYKFGDVSLAYAKSLLSCQRPDDATAHLEKHVKRWRHPEGLYMLAWQYTQCGRTDEARSHLHAMLMEIESSPPAIARKHGAWLRRGRSLLRKIGA
jgi:hypothetical protein